MSINVNQMQKDHKKDAERPQKQTALVARERDRYNIDAAGLLETRLERQSTLQEKPAFSSGQRKSLG